MIFFNLCPYTMSKYSSVRILFYLFVLLSHCQIRQTRLMHHRSWIKDTFRNVNVPTQLISDHLSKFIKTKKGCQIILKCPPHPHPCVQHIRSSKVSAPEDSDVPHLSPGVVCRPQCLLLILNYPPLVTS